MSQPPVPRKQIVIQITPGQDAKINCDNVIIIVQGIAEESHRTSISPGEYNVDATGNMTKV